MSSYGYELVKAGWLYRQSTILHRWKKNWFVLDKFGDLRYFDGPDSPRAEDRIVVRASVVEIKTGPDCQKADPPESVKRSQATFFELCLKDKGRMLLCAESLDEMRAWQISLEEARVMPSSNAPLGVMSSTTISASPGHGIGLSPYEYHGFTSYGANGYPGHVISTTNVYGAPPPQVIHHTNGTTTYVNSGVPNQVVYVEDNRRHRRYGGRYGMGVPYFFVLP